MNLFKKALLCTFSATILTASLLPTAPLFGVSTVGNSQHDTDDSDETLRDFIRSKRKIPLEKKAKNLKIAGEVHSEWAYQRERYNGSTLRQFSYQQAEIDQTGTVQAPGTQELVGWHYPKVRFDLFVDWDYQRMYARTDVRVEANMGVDGNGWKREIDPGGYTGSGDKARVNLKQAYVGYDIFKNNTDRLFVEIGRRGNLYKVFESELAFNSRFDGLYLEYQTKRCRFGEIYAEFAGMVIDSVGNHFAWGTEFGIENICGSNFSGSYTFVDWHKKGLNRWLVTNPQGYRFKVSQWRLNWYNEAPFQKGMPLQLFGAFLMNHSPSKKTNVDLFPVDVTIYKAQTKKIGRRNTGAYVGLQYGDAVHEGDWYFKGVAAYLEAQCIPDNDQRNIGTGNQLGDSFTAFGRGNTNWKGYYFKTGYVLTENFVLEAQYDHSWAMDDSINGTHQYNRFAIETTYSF